MAQTTEPKLLESDVEQVDATDIHARKPGFAETLLNAMRKAGAWANETAHALGRRSLKGSRLAAAANLNEEIDEATTSDALAKLQKDQIKLVKSLKNSMEYHRMRTSMNVGVGGVATVGFALAAFAIPTVALVPVLLSAYCATRVFKGFGDMARRREAVNELDNVLALTDKLTEKYENVLNDENRKAADKEAFYRLGAESLKRNFSENGARPQQAANVQDAEFTPVDTTPRLPAPNKNKP